MVQQFSQVRHAAGKRDCGLETEKRPWLKTPLGIFGDNASGSLVIEGRWLVEGGLPLHVDAGRLRHEHGEAARAALTAS